MTDYDIVRCADICDDDPTAQICELMFHDYGKRACFHGEAVTFSTYEDNKGILDVLRRGGKGKVLVVDGRGSMRRALCGGNIAAEALEHGWAGLVFNGAVRDTHEFAELDFGAKALKCTAMRPRTDGIGLADVTLKFGGVVINPGDYIYADLDAVIVCKKPIHGR
ncbi:MAG: ribonuclease E activity regulator RraA [Rhodospirillales bacterium]